MVTVAVYVVQLVPTMRILSIRILEGRLMVSNYALKNIVSMSLMRPLVMTSGAQI